MTHAIVPFSLYIWGIFFAPIYSPHMSERLGRNPGYVFSTLGLAVFTLGSAYSRTFVQLGVCRFFAGLLAGSNVVQIEGTYADVWPALYTSSYYVFIAGSQYFGAAVGKNQYFVPFEVTLTLAPRSYRELACCSRRELAMDSVHYLDVRPGGTTPWSWYARNLSTQTRPTARSTKEQAKSS